MEKGKSYLANGTQAAGELKAELAELKIENQRLKELATTALARLDQQSDYQESQERFRTVFESSRLGNKIISADLKILQVNPAMVALLGYSKKEDIVGTKIMDYSPPDQKQQWEMLQEKLWKKASPSFSLETKLLKKDGSVIWCQVTSILFKDKGETLGYTIIEDITEQHQLRQQKEEFISVASHELKTPLTSLKAGLRLLNRKVMGEAVITAKHIQLAQSAVTFTNKLSHLVDDLLNSTRIEQGQLTLNKSRFKLCKLLDECCTHIALDDRYYLTNKGELSLEIVADQQKIEQVLVNLVNNAVKYAPDSAEIAIHVEGQQNQVKIAVTDRGKGILPEKLSEVFKRYYRADPERSAVSGLGLGLYICSEIIRRHGGKMGAESVIGQGSTFWFTIPVCA